MGSLVETAEKVKSLFEKEFEPAEVELSIREGIVVILVSTRFQGMDDMDRQNLAWDLLEKHLDRDERRAIAIVVALTPQENAFHLAGKIP